MRETGLLVANLGVSEMSQVSKYFFSLYNGQIFPVHKWIESRL